MTAGQALSSPSAALLHRSFMEWADRASHAAGTIVFTTRAIQVGGPLQLRSRIEVGPWPSHGCRVAGVPPMRRAPGIHGRAEASADTDVPVARVKHERGC